jgi:MFS family permease
MVRFELAFRFVSPIYLHLRKGDVNWVTAAWFGSLVNGPIADRYGRKGSILMAVVVFTIGSAIQAGAISVGMVFAGMLQHSLPEKQTMQISDTLSLGRVIAGLSVGMLTMIVPMYMSEVSTPGIRGTLVVLQQCKTLAYLANTKN